MLVEATRFNYKSPHAPFLVSVRMRCTHEENKKLHKHYKKVNSYLLQYWEDHWQQGRYSDCNTHLLSNLRYKPQRVKGRSISSKEVSRLSHRPEDVPRVGKYYTHLQIFEMMKDKVMMAMPYDRKTLQDFTESMYRRFNAYIEWMKEWDIKYNQGIYITELDKCKVQVKWL